jgi:hypothetical protein
MSVTAIRLPLVFALLLAGCGSKPLALPDQPLDRAATCGIVAAAEARAATAQVNAPLPLAAHGRIVHYALLAGSEGGDFSPETAGQVSLRMSALQDRVTQGKWQALIPACKSAYPDAEKQSVALPEDRFAAQLQCSELAQFLVRALEAQKSSYVNELRSYSDLRSKLNDAIAPGLRAEAGSDFETQQKKRHEALSAAAHLGPPTAVMASCLERFR